jgi:ketosteroid isomerase-like protein
MPLRRRHALAAVGLLSPAWASGQTAMPAPPAVAQLGGPDAASLRDAELAFADSMARRDLAAFGRAIADDAVFLNGGQPLRGKAAIVAFWSRFFEGPAAPFAWAPDLVAVLDGGLLGYSAGPVRNPAGRVFSRFHSTWRRENVNAPWLVVFDNGQATCPPAGG